VLQPVELEKYHERAMDEAAHIIPAEVRAARTAIWPMFLDTIELNARLPRTLIHSDVHVSNWYRTNDGRMGLADWGCVAKGNGARDLAYALSTALAVDDRREWESDLIARYLDAFGRHGGSPPETNEMLDHYRRHLTCALLMWTPTLCHSPLLPDMQPREVSLAMIERITAALADHDVLRRRRRMHTAEAWTDAR
jgi:aminoglycoside phosphotransferase (APT) family kinase protein